MTSRIDHWQRRYRVPGPALQGRLDALASGRVLEVYDEDLRRAFGDGPELVLVRQVDLRLHADLASSGESALARKWGESMAAAVVRAVAGDPGKGDVVRYPDECALLADFLAEVADGQPANQWYFARFAELRRRSPADTVAAALLHQPRCLPRVIRYLSRSSRLRRVLACLDENIARRLWTENAAGLPPTPEAERPLFAAALTLLAELGAASVSAVQAEALFRDFCAATGGPTDWRDPTHLAQTVFAAARFLLARNPLRQPPRAHLETAVGRLDWLDRDWLRAQLPSLWSEKGTVETPSSTAALRSTPTPRQGQWLEALRRALPRLAPDLDRADLAAPKNLFLALAALTDEYPAWTDDSALSAFLEAIFRAAAQLSSTPRSREARETSPIRHLGEQGESIVRELARLAAPGRSSPDSRSPLAANIAQPGEFHSGEGEIDWVATDIAGTLLLLRAFQDLRLGMLARRCAFRDAGPDGPRWLFAALAARLAGLPSADTPDPGLQLFGPEPAVWGEARQASESFQQGLARTLAGHRLVGEPEAFTSVLVATGAATLRLIGDASAQLWPFAVPVESDQSGESLPFVESLSAGAVGEAWTDATLLVTAQALIRAWAIWLQRLGRSSTPYLLSQFVRRPGQIALAGSTLLVELDSRPLDIVLRLSGYLEPIELLFDWPFRRVEFQIGRAG